MDELIRLDTKNEEFPIDGRELWEKLESGQKFADWVKDRIEKYGFTAGQDFFVKLRKTSGRPAEEYRFTLDTGKELAMLENNEKGRLIRKYFIEAEKQNRQNKAVRLVGKEIRKELTDVLKETGINEQMHGFGHKTVTDMIYKTIYDKNAAQLRIELGLPRTANVRDKLSPEEWKEIAKIEDCTKSLFAIGYTYQEVKQMLSEKYIKRLPKL
jgi:phage anti-repressor protein